MYEKLPHSWSNVSFYHLDRDTYFIAITVSMSQDQLYKSYFLVMFTLESSDEHFGNKIQGGTTHKYLQKQP